MKTSDRKERQRRIKVMIEEVQALMIAYVTDGREGNQPAQYQSLYVDLDLELEGLGYANPNPHKSLEVFWGFCKLKEMGTWADRRAYVRELYGDVLLDLERHIRRARDPRHWETANAQLTDNLSPVRAQWLKAKNFIYSQPPDYENSIKESINSIESILKILLNAPKGTLGKILPRADIDSDISRLISQAYGLLSNKDFVRHGGVIDQGITETEAEFFLEFAAISIIYIKHKLSASTPH